MTPTSRCQRCIRNPTNQLRGYAEFAVDTSRINFQHPKIIPIDLRNKVRPETTWMVTCGDPRMETLLDKPLSQNASLDGRLCEPNVMVTACDVISLKTRRILGENITHWTRGPRGRGDVQGNPSSNEASSDFYPALRLEKLSSPSRQCEAQRGPLLPSR